MVSQIFRHYYAVCNGALQYSYLYDEKKRQGPVFLRAFQHSSGNQHAHKLFGVLVYSGNIWMLSAAVSGALQA
jgi:hypothetical protein